MPLSDEVRSAFRSIEAALPTNPSRIKVAAHLRLLADKVAHSLNFEAEIAKAQQGLAFFSKINDEIHPNSQLPGSLLQIQRGAEGELDYADDLLRNLKSVLARKFLRDAQFGKLMPTLRKLQASVETLDEDAKYFIDAEEYKPNPEEEPDENFGPETFQLILNQERRKLAQLRHGGTALFQSLVKLLKELAEPADVGF